MYFIFRALIKPLLPFDTLRSLQITQLMRFARVLVVGAVLARLIDKPQISDYEYLVTVTSAFSFFWISGFINTFIPFYNNTNAEKQPLLITQLFALMCGLSIVSSMALLVSYPFWLTDLPFAWFGAYVIFTLFNEPAFLVEYFLLVKNRPLPMMWYAIAQQVFQALVILVPLWLGYDFLIALMLTAAVGFLKFLVVLWLVMKNGKPGWDDVLLKKFLRQSWPVIFSLLVGGSLAYIDSFLVREWPSFTDIDFALFQYGKKELPIALLLANALSNVGSGEVARAVRHGTLSQALTRLRQSGLRLMHIIFPLTVFLIIFSKPLYDFFYTESFVPAAAIFNIYLLLTVTRLTFPQTVVLGLGKMRWLARVSIVEWILNVSLNILFLYLFGIWGIAMATVISYYAEKGILIFLLKKEGIALNQYTHAGWWAAYSVIIWIVFGLWVWFGEKSF